MCGCWREGGRILDKEDALTSEAITGAFGRRGIEVIDGIDGVDRLEKTEQVLRLFYLRQGEALPLEVEAVLVAAG